MTLLSNGRTYLDWNATSIVCEPARKALFNLINETGNPSSVHLEGRRARIILESSRDKIQELLCINNGRLIFTSGATEAAGLILHNASQRCAIFEHECVKKWCDVSVLVQDDGQIQESEIPKIRVLQFANSETGILQNLSEKLHFIDAAQAIGKIHCNFQKLKPESIIMSSHKICGPAGVGAAFLSEEADFSPLIKGGMQEHGLRAGTESFMLIAAFSEAVKFSMQLLVDGVWDEIEELRNYMEDEIGNVSKETIIVGSENRRLPNTSCIVTPGWRGENQVIELDLKGVSVSSGSACSSGKLQKSETLMGMGFSESLAQNSLRISLGPHTKKRDIENFLFAWKELYLKSRDNTARK